MSVALIRCLLMLVKTSISPSLFNLPVILDAPNTSAASPTYPVSHPLLLECQPRAPSPCLSNSRHQLAGSFLYEAEDKKKELDLDLSDLQKAIEDEKESIATLKSEIAALQEWNCIPRCFLNTWLWVHAYGGDGLTTTQNLARRDKQANKFVSPKRGAGAGVDSVTWK